MGPLLLYDGKRTAHMRGKQRHSSQTPRYRCQTWLYWMAQHRVAFGYLTVGAKVAAERQGLGHYSRVIISSDRPSGLAGASSVCVDAGDQALGDLRTYRWSRSALLIRPLALRRTVTVSGQSIPDEDKSTPSASVIVRVPVLAHTAPIAPSPSSVRRKRKYRMAVGGSFKVELGVQRKAVLWTRGKFDEPVERLYVVLYVCTRALALSMHAVGAGIKQHQTMSAKNGPFFGDLGRRKQP